MDKKYKPQEWENKIYHSWEKAKAFTPERNHNQQPFTIVMPPPNANGALHIGHAMFITLEDILARFYRMQGRPTLLLPGADHAGILTQVVFERQLAKQGKSRYHLGRYKFYRQCLKFTQNNKKTMYNQFKRVGASADWSREKFTLDKDISSQVIRTFLDLYQDGLAYRGKRLVNWCPRCMTALSDLEIEHQEVKGKFYYIKYPLKTHSDVTGQKRYLVVATTRPETMLGDTALAVNPKDNRYNQFVGQKAILPIVSREIPIIADQTVDPEFGTGVVKVTPAHDPNDWQMAKRHKLKAIAVVNFDLKMTRQAGKDFVGLKLKEARKKVCEILDRKNLLLKDRAHIHSVGHCERCKTIIEPLISQQWFINMSKRSQIKNPQLRKILDRKTISLKELGIKAVTQGWIKILPKHFKKNYLQWMDNLHDWCLSRQIWWGHQLPIWYCGIKGLSELQKQMNPDLLKKQKDNTDGCGQIIVSLSKPKACPRCHKRTTIIQDPDVFDTWFSSGQWVHNSLGYPNSHDFKYFYPASVMETGYEILNIWVAKMIMLSLYCTGKSPFKTVYLHGLVRDAFGEKMSKSKGNVINPLEVIQEHGADALRLALTIGTSPGNDLSLGKDKIKGYRNFTNKIWNIGRFIELGFKSTRKQIPWYKTKMEGLQKEDKQIVKKLESLIKKTTRGLEKFKFSQTGEAVYQFLWHEFADQYIEQVKQRVWDKDKVALSVLRHVYLNCLKLLHPFVPFVTEAVWSQMPRKNKKPLINSSWPKV